MTASKQKIAANSGFHAEKAGRRERAPVCATHRGRVLADDGLAVGLILLLVVARR